MRRRTRLTVAIIGVCVAVGVGAVAIVALTNNSESQRASNHSGDSPSLSRPAVPAVPSARPDALASCRAAFRKDVVDAALTTADTVRQSGVGVNGAQFPDAFPGYADGGSAAWCMVRVDIGCYDEWAVAGDGSKEHIVTAGCGWSSGHPRAGPAYWTF